MGVKITKVEETDKEVKLSKVDAAYTDLVKVFKKHKLNVREILIATGNCVYALGASIGGYQEKGPGVSELEKLYATNPTVDVAMMITGLQMCTWESDLGKTIEKIKEEQKKDK